MGSLQTERMDKTVLSIVDLAEPSDEPLYWKSQPTVARLRALELMRQVMYGRDYATAGLQRILTVVERAAD